MSRRGEGDVFAESVEKLEVPNVDIHKHRLDHLSKIRRS